MPDDGPIPGPAYEAGNTNGYTGMKLWAANNPPSNNPPTNAPTVGQKAQIMQMQFGSVFGALERADAVAERTHGSKAQAWVEKEQTLLAQSVGSALGNDPDAANVIGTLNMAAQNEAAPVMRLPRLGV